MSPLRTVIIAALSAATFASCEHEGEGTRTVTGRLVLDCNQTPATNRALTVSWMLRNGMKAELNGNAGEATTDSGGNFTVEIPNYLSGELTISERNKGLDWVEDYYITQPAGEAISLGTIFREAPYKSIVKVVIGPNHPGDTFYVGSNNVDYDTFTGAGTWYTSKEYKGQQYMETSQPTLSRQLRWAQGKANYFSTTPPPGTIVSHRFNARFNRCAASDTTELIIP